MHTARYTRELAGQDFAFGVKFRPGGFQPFLRGLVSALSDSALPLEHVFGPDAATLVAAVRACRAGSCGNGGDGLGGGSAALAMALLAQDFLRAHLPAPDAAEDKAAVAQIQAGTVDSWSDLALEPGYFDQAHFIRDFRWLVGRSPADYARRAL